VTDFLEGPDLFGAWLDETKRLQAEGYGAYPDQLEGFDLRYYLTWNHSAAVIELGEMLEETRWKPWDNTDLESDPIVPDPDPYTKEAVDALHFVANMLVAGRVDVARLNRAYRAKMQVNWERQQRDGGYDSKRGVDKCQKCLRSFDDVPRSEAWENHCVKCEADRMRGTL
jgi:hypothetical protein